ncbi:MAG: FkbM family methyltransferase [Caldilineales bacterium]
MTLSTLLRLPLRLIPPNQVLPVLSGPLRGRRWIAGSGVHACWLGSYEADKQRLFSRLIQPGMVIYDAGAHVGFYTLLAAHLTGPRGHVLAIEPSPRNQALLQRHIALNGYGDRVTLLAAALAEQSGTLRFATAGEQAYQGHLSAQGELTVQAVTLDELAASGETPPPHLIKMDVEGAELNALRGAADVLRHAQPMLMLATHSTELQQSCCTLLAEYGYVVQTLPGSHDELIAYPAARAAAFRELSA